MSSQSTLRFLAACVAGALTSQAALADDISWWYEAANPDQQKIIEDLIVSKYEQANPGDKLIIDIRGNELDKQLRLAMNSGTPPDIVFTPGPSYVAGMATAGQLLPLDDYARKLGWNDRVLPVFLSLGTYDGVLYALPKTYETLGLFYNKTLFDKHGWQPPKSIAELEALSEKIKAEGIFPMAVGNRDWRGSNEWYVSMAFNSIAGPDKVYQALTGEIPWSDPAFVEAVNTLKRWWDKGYFTTDDYFSLNGDDTNAMVSKGEAAISPTGTWNFQNVDRYFTASGVEAGFTPFPSASGVAYPIYALGIGSTFSVAKEANNPDGAVKVLDFIFTPEFYAELNAVWQGEWNLPLTDLASISGSDISPLYVKSMTSLSEAVDKGQYGYTSWTFLPPATNTHLINGIEEVWLGSATAEEYLAKMDEIYQQDKAEGNLPVVPPR